MIIVSKGNGRNYYWYTDENKNPVEVVKEGGRFYVAKFVEKFWLTAIWNPLKQFTLID